MPKYIVHIGPPKTGSTYLQSLLFHFRHLMAANGINYPDNWWTEADEYIHDPLFTLLREARYPQVIDSFRQINAGNWRVVVLSSEAFEDLTPEQFSVLRDAIGPHPIEFVYYCRRWCERIPSAWKQTIKTGRYSTFPEYFMESTRHALLAGNINYSLIWATIAQVFGRNCLKLVSYNNLREDKVDLFRHFTSTFLDWTCDAADHMEPLRVNVSPNHFDNEILRALNWMDFQAVGRYRPNMHLKYSALRKSIDTRALQEEMAGDLEHIEVSDGAECFRLSWNEMQKYADCIVPKTPSGGRLFERATIRFPHIRPNYLLNERAARELRSLYKRMQREACDIEGLV